MLLFSWFSFFWSREASLFYTLHPHLLLLQLRFSLVLLSLFFLLHRDWETDGLVFSFTDREEREREWPTQTTSPGSKGICCIWLSMNSRDLIIYCFQERQMVVDHVCVSHNYVSTFTGVNRKKNWKRETRRRRRRVSSSVNNICCAHNSVLLSVSTRLWIKEFRKELTTS